MLANKFYCIVIFLTLFVFLCRFPVFPLSRLSYRLYLCLEVSKPWSRAVSFSWSSLWSLAVVLIFFLFLLLFLFL